MELGGATHFGLSRGHSSSLYAPVLLLLAVSVFSPSLGFDFVYDDHFQIVSNYLITSLSYFDDIWRSPLHPGDLYRPVTIISFQLSYIFHGMEPAGFHALNVLLHGMNSYLVYSVLRLVFSNRMAFVSAALFALNPIHIEAVVSVVGRAELLAAFFGLLAILTFVSPQRFTALHGGVGLLLLTLSALSKESGLMYTLLTALVVSFRPQYKRNKGKRLLWLSSVSLLVGALFLSLRYGAIGELFPSHEIDSIDNILASLPFLERAIASLVLLGDYFVLTIVPFPLSADYSFAAITADDFAFSLELFLKLLLIALLLLCGILGSRTVPAASLGALWFLLSFALTANLLFPIGTVFAERLVYTPSIGVCLFLGALITKLPTLPRRATLSCFCFIYLVITLQDQYRWESDRTLFERQMELAPESLRTRMNYAVLLRDQGRFGEASQVIEGALRIRFNNPDIHYIKATILTAQGRDEEAEIILRTGLSFSPRHVRSLVGLGRILLNREELSLAEALFEEAKRDAEMDVDVLLSFYLLAAKKGDIRELEKLDVLLQERAPRHPLFIRLKRDLKRQENRWQPRSPSKEPSLEERP